MKTDLDTKSLSTVPDIDAPLTPDEAHLLADCERTINAGLKVFYEVGRALLTISDLRLYRTSYATFEQYCKEKWHFSRQHAYRQINAWESYQIVAPSGVTPTSERQLRALGRLRPEQRPEAWKMASNEAVANGTEVTNQHVENAVQRLLPSPSRRSKSKKISLRLCVACRYSFSDEHHIKTRSSGGKHFETISLCPNHHRYAGLLQLMLDNDYEREEIEAYAHRHFDAPFNEKLLNKLLDHSYQFSSSLADSLGLFVDAMVELERDTEDRDHSNR